MLPNAIKLKSKINSDIFYTLPEWKDQEIDGVPFIKVFRMPVRLTPNKTLQTFFFKKDSLEKVK